MHRFAAISTMAAHGRLLVAATKAPMLRSVRPSSSTPLRSAETPTTTPVDGEHWEDAAVETAISSSQSTKSTGGTVLEGK